MKQWSSTTCITFKERTDEKAFIYFFVGGSCSSEVGRTGDKQYVSLAPHCWTAGEVAHEIAHALGFYHEQSRPDRDEYVTINWNNIVEAEKVNFAKYGPSRINTLGVPYDYRSLMHLDDKAFSKNGEPTIVPKQAGIQIGQRESPSALDIKQMNLLYKCSGDCVDRNQYCRQWASQGYCYSNPDYMIPNCKRSCGTCFSRKKILILYLDYVRSCSYAGFDVNDELK
ncbi:zinc metalloproteinase nas-15-like [Stylophora pistillata]|uniref:zinc metalloproteinase nas-15-like n=1 Tax=Stylophora pistillata TaxID=50429 RepID=UPI000C0465EE|nr:zinc metalloproteinase nas-15-like [Stylophora pistillata]